MYPEASSQKILGTLVTRPDPDVPSLTAQPDGIAETLVGRANVCTRHESVEAAREYLRALGHATWGETLPSPPAPGRLGAVRNWISSEPAVDSLQPWERDALLGQS